MSLETIRKTTFWVSSAAALILTVSGISEYFSDPNEFTPSLGRLSALLCALSAATLSSKGYVKS